MPENFPTVNPETGEISDVPYYTLDEIADLFHVSVPTARRLIAEHHWPHLQIVRRIYMSPTDIADALDSLRVGPIPEGGPPTLGWAVPADPWAKPDDGETESVR